jgi:hypothetical protein
VTPERSRGLQLYALAAAVLVGGGVWFVRAAPDLGDDSQVRAWRATVTRELPDVQPQIDADTVMVARGADHEATAPVPGGSFTLTMVCAGAGRVRVRLSSTGNDTGLPVACADQPQPVTLNVGLGTEFYLSMIAETDGAVFRWRLTPASMTD